MQARRNQTKIYTEGINVCMITSDYKIINVGGFSTIFPAGLLVLRRDLSVIPPVFQKIIDFM